MDTDTGRKKPRENENLGSPMLCIMGHVDTGKTKLLDCIRGTNVQERELINAKLNPPGLLVLDTPGHESFTYYRFMASLLCDFAILVVDTLHGLEQQTLESLYLLRGMNKKFIVVLNNVDKLRGWKPCHNTPITEAVEQQTQDVQLKFNGLLDDITYLFEQVGPSTQYLNTELLNTENIAINGRHVQHCAYKCNKTVLDVEVVEDHGTTIDFVLVNGVLHEGEQIVVCGMRARIGTPICIPSREFIDIGRVASIENNHLPVDYARKGQKVAIKISYAKRCIFTCCTKACSQKRSLITILNYLK
ncbi:Eukaryotic translation initiation factor 5B [Glycine soja]|uniref:Eukaryotic translation initiation factor 5B n=1 Tax=Glycine soja TaxID=3848 RepID=A0A0B2QI86_GLYSO|nr:Eukaryotic translation initiation factor 5B [Glycine soja]